jgi:hypothetical protein
MFFMLPRAEDNDLLFQWAEELWRADPERRLDPSVLRAYQPIFTARPIFKGWVDPVPEWRRVRILDGYEDCLELELPKPKPKVPREPKLIFQKIADTPANPELEELMAADEGNGVPPLPETSPSGLASVSMNI